MAISDAQFKTGVVAGGIAAMLVLGSLRFCGSVGLPPKSTTRVVPRGNATQLMGQTNALEPVYREYIQKDALAAGMGEPSMDDLRRPFPSQLDDARHVLEIGQTFKTLGLELTVEKAGEALGLAIKNTTDKDLAYLVETSPTHASSACNSVRPLAFNAMVIAKGQTELRAECVWRQEMAVVVTRVETVEVPAFSAWYLGQVPPVLVGIEDRIGRGHHGAVSKLCSPVVSQAVRSGLDRKEIRWRDLVDFYARHRCQTYQFPVSYRAFADGDKRTLPVTE